MSLQYDDIIFTRVEVGGSFCLLGRLLVQGGGGGGDGHEQGHKHGRQQGPHLIIGLISETTGGMLSTFSPLNLKSASKQCQEVK